jgi:hypothetical protein
LAALLAAFGFEAAALGFGAAGFGGAGIDMPGMDCANAGALSACVAIADDKRKMRRFRG